MKSRIFSTILIAIILISPLMAQARYFDPNDIITDAELFDGNALSRTAIQNFLEAKNSALATVTAVIGGAPKLVSEMVYEIGRQYNISQKFLLAKLQQEQGLIEKSEASQKTLDWATGYSCFNSRCNDKYKGIYAQLDASADTQRIYMEKGKSLGYFGYSVGVESKTKDGAIVRPKNQATANLYIYTPYQGSESGIGGNYFFSRVWNKYFTERMYPDGSLLVNQNTGTYWQIEKNKRRKFVTQEIFLKDHKAEDAIPVDQTRLSYYEVGDAIEFGNNTLVEKGGAGIMYLLSDGKKHRVAGTMALAALGYHIADTSPVKPMPILESQLEVYPEGEPITADSLYPQGVLVTAGDATIYLVKHGIKRQLLDEAVWQENYQRQEPAVVSAATLSQYENGDPVKLNDGSLVKSPAGKYYIISDQEKHRVASEDVVNRLYGALAASTAPLASDALLALHADADPIDYIDDTVADPANYVSYADRQGQKQAEQKSYLALYDTVDVPSPLIAGSSAVIKVSFRNRGTAVWTAGKTYVKLIDENSEQSSFIAENRIALAVDAGNGQIASFSVPVKAPLLAGSVKEWFILEYENSEGLIVEMPGGLVGKGISVVSGVSAQILEQNIPVAIKNTWKPIDITIKMKNTGTDEVWTSRRAALSLQAENGEDSPFYDRYDWIDKKVAAVPINKSKIAPGETAILKFTLDPRGVKAGTYKLVFSLELRDEEEQVYINGKSQWERFIRVDK